MSCSEADPDVVVVGAGISGLSFARAWAEKHPGKRVQVFERRRHLGGNCHDFNGWGGILVQTYGPHIFHTSDRRVWEFLSKFTEWKDYQHKVIAKYKGDYYPLPINRNTINKFFKIDLRSEQDVSDFLQKKRIHVREIRNSRDVIVNIFGEELYEAFVKHYTKKQWGVYPDELPATILQRLPVRFDDNDHYYDAIYQGIPKEGFTRMFERMIDLPNIEVRLGVDFIDMMDRFGEDTTVVYTGRIDELFGMRYGALPYLYTDFVFETFEMDAYQPNFVVNYPEEEIPYIRSSEYKKITGQSTPKTIVCFEYVQPTGTPTHPIPGEANKVLYEKYRSIAPKNYIFLGRLGRYSYLDIDVACGQALKMADEIK